VDLYFLQKNRLKGWDLKIIVLYGLSAEIVRDPDLADTNKKAIAHRRSEVRAERGGGSVRCLVNNLYLVFVGETPGCS
jgi:hypothetical protein